MTGWVGSGSSVGVPRCAGLDGSIYGSALRLVLCMDKLDVPLLTGLQTCSPIIEISISEPQFEHLIAGSILLART